MGGNGSAPDPVGVFMSTDQGNTWTQRSATGVPTNSQGGYSIQMDIDPASPGDGANDILYFGAVGLARSDDSGATFTNISNGIHPDFHSKFQFVLQPPPNPSVVFAGNDGGFFRSDDKGAHWTGTGLPGAPPTINEGALQTGLFSISISATIPPGA